MGKRKDVIPENDKFYTDKDGTMLIRKADQAIIFGTKNAVIPDGIKKIVGAFYGKEGQEIPASVEYIDVDKFYLNKFTVSPENKVYDSRDNCNALIEKATGKLLVAGNPITFIPDGVTELNDCVEITGEKLVLPESMKKIGPKSLGKIRVKELVIPAGVEYIDELAFATDWDFAEISEKITVSPDNQYYSFVDNCLVEKKSNKLITCCSCASKLPDNVEILGAGAYYPKFDPKTFKWPENLKEMYSFPESLRVDNIIVIPDGVEKIANMSFSNYAREIVIPESVKEIGEMTLDVSGDPGSIEIVVYAKKGSYAEKWAAGDRIITSNYGYSVVVKND